MRETSWIRDQPPAPIIRRWVEPQPAPKPMSKTARKNWQRTRPLRRVEPKNP